MGSFVELILLARFMAHEIAIPGNMPMVIVAILLHGLHNQKLDVPVDPRMLLGAPP